MPFNSASDACEPHPDVTSYGTTPQSEAIPLVLGGGDVIAAAETGSGKTGAFGIPVLQIVHEALRDAAATRAVAVASSSKSSKSSPPTVVAMSVVDRDATFAVSFRGDVAQARDERSWAGGRATAGVSSGKHAFECVVRDDGLVRVGWSGVAGSLGGLGTDKVRSIHWFPYDRVGVVNADP